ncbi:MAG: polysaccharide deacetylase family protein [Bradyrhizobium sp.]|nr:polysaccharide deacetylase family protein [Bradyrhizobium sp.]
MRAALQCVLNFHGIGEPHPGVSNDEAPYWLSRERFRMVLNQVTDLRHTGRNIVLTFDDGNLSDLTVAAPILAEHNLQAEFFVLTGRLNDPKYLSPDGLRTLRDMGMRIGLHGQDHVDWRELSPEALRQETTIARKQLARIIEAPIYNVGIPFGAYDRRIITHLIQEGFSAIYTSDGGYARSDAQVRPRTSLRADMSDDLIEIILRDGFNLRTRLRRRMRGIVKQHLI